MKMTDGLKVTRYIKWIQLILYAVLEAAYLLVLKGHPMMWNNMFTNKSLLALNLIMWVWMVFAFSSILYDLIKIRKLALESHILSQRAYLDHLTGIPNRFSLDYIYSLSSSAGNLDGIGCSIMEITNLAKINKRLGRKAGDTMITDFCNLLETAGDSYGFAGRNNGNQFLMIIENCTPEKLDSFQKDLEEKLTAYNHECPSAPIICRYAHVINTDNQMHFFTDLMQAAVNALNEARKSNK